MAGRSSERCWLVVAVTVGALAGAKEEGCDVAGEASGAEEGDQVMWGAGWVRESYGATGFRERSRRGERKEGVTVEKKKRGLQLLRNGGTSWFLVANDEDGERDTLTLESEREDVARVTLPMTRKLKVEFQWFTNFVRCLSSLLLPSFC